MIRLQCYVASIFVAITITTSAHAAPMLQRGINLSSWLANNPRQPLDAGDFVQIKQAGFDHVRLPVNPELFGFSFTHDSAMDFAAVDRAIAMAQAQHLPVILDIHTNAEFKHAVEKDPKAAARFVELWSAIAKHYQSVDADALAFELLNEPPYYHATDAYKTLMETTITAIRAVDTQRLVIVAAPEGSSIEGLQKLQPITDAHIAYDVHFYEPYMVTHQGIQQCFAKKMLRYFHDVPYPATHANHDASFYAESATNASQAQDELDDYTAQHWDAARIAERIATAKTWATQHHAQLICGEFGVFRHHIDAASRYRWIADVRTVLDANHIPWEIWDYSDAFGIVTLEGATRLDPADGTPRFITPGTRRFEPEALTALGLRK